MPVTRHRFRCLVDQKDSRIVWLSYEHDNRKAPIFDPTLNFHRISTLTDLNVWEEYCKYDLFLHSGGIVASVPEKTLKGDLQEFSQLELKRAKATAIEFLELSIELQYEKLGFSYTYMIDNIKHSGITDKWILLFQQEYNCSYDDAKKLISFKLEEYDNLVFNLEQIRLSYTNKFIKASSLNELDEIFDLSMTSLLITSRINLKEFDSIKKR